MSVRLRRIARTSAPVTALYPALALLLSVFAIAPLAYPGFFQSYTGYNAVYNLIDLHAQLANIPLWSPVWGRAYDVLRMDGPLGYWLAELFHIVGISPVDSIKLIYALGFLLSAVGMYALVRRVFRNEGAALLAAVVYIYFPAHIAAVYIRGAFGEALLWGIMPLALWSAYAVADKTPRRRFDWLWCIAAFGAAVLAQPGLGILFCILARVWVALLGPRPAVRGFFRSGAGNSIFIGLLAGILLLVPSALAQPVLAKSTDFTPAFVYPFQLLSATWGTDLPRADWLAQAPYQIGFAALGLTILAVALLLRGAPASDDARHARAVTWFALGASAVFLVLMLPWAEPLWNLGLNMFMQYPAQLLLFVGFMLPLAAGSILVSDARFQDIPLLAALVIVPLLAVYPYLNPEFLDFSPTRPALARFNNDEIALLDAQIIRPPGTWRHGASVQLDLTWQALRQPNRDYTVFLHILDDNGQEWGSTDEKPQGGSAPTLKWVPGRVISDTHTVQIDLNGPPEGYHMELGIYPSTTGERALTETGADTVRIDQKSSQ